jgi:hypothetical protein
MLRLLVVPAFENAVDERDGPFHFGERPVENRQVVIGER